MRNRHKVLIVLVAGAAIAPAVSGIPLTAPNGPARAQQVDVGVTPAVDTTSPAEKKRVDSVPAPKLHWRKCAKIAQCATVRLPLDYDEPKGATTKIALLRVKAGDPKKRIGSLFVNPGGPGASATELASAARLFPGKHVLSRFDVVGFDPRGVGDSKNLKCFKSKKERTRALAGMEVPFPVGTKEEAAFIASAKALGRACSTTGMPLAGTMSTAEVARDMDVLRRAVGDPKLSYLGESYGTVIGQYYANMFPDRVRAMALDGVVNPVHWTGTDQTANQPPEDRMRTGDGSYQAMHEMLLRCGQAGAKKCSFAKYGDPVHDFDVLAARLKAKSVPIGHHKLTYADLVDGLRGGLASSTGAKLINTFLHDLWQATSPASTVKRVAAAKKALKAEIDFGGLVPPDNSLETYSAVFCTDARYPDKAESWPAIAAADDRRTPYFRLPWVWDTVQCAGDSWTAHDEDAYTGPFNRRTSAPVLFVGGYHDPTTNYDEAVSAGKLLPGSRLLSSDSWGHTAYSTSACVKNAVGTYLTAGTLPPAGKVCVGDDQPFKTPKSHPAKSG